jgi:hypothetical protein
MRLFDFGRVYQKRLEADNYLECAAVGGALDLRR